MNKMKMNKYSLTSLSSTMDNRINGHRHLISMMACLAVAASLTGCAGITSVQDVNNNPPGQTVQQDRGEVLWRDNKAWLLSRLPRAEHIVQDILLVLHDYPNRDACLSNNAGEGCKKLVAFLRQRMNTYELKLLPEGLGSGHYAFIDGDTAYVFRMTDWAFSGIANLSNNLYFTIPDAPLRRVDGMSFAFGADGKSDVTSFWSLYQHTITDNFHAPAPLPVGKYELTRTELDAAGVPKQIDLLTPQQRNERDLTKQGLTWQRRTQMEAIKICSASEQKASRKSDGRGKRNRSLTPESTVTDSAAQTATTMTEALQGKAHLNCKTGTGYVVTPDGIAGEVYRLVRDSEGLDAVISATAKEIPGGVVRYRYPAVQENFNTFQPETTKDMVMQIETTSGDNKLELNLRADTGVSPRSLTLPGSWYSYPDYLIHGKNISNPEFAELFLRAYRDCLMKDVQGKCKNIPDFFMSLQNQLYAEEFVQYIFSNYLSKSKDITH
jgi:hypothetical protein